MTESTVTAKVALPTGDVQTFTISLVRDGVSWKVTNVTSDATSASSSSADSAAATSTTSTTTGTTTTGTSSQGQ